MQSDLQERQSLASTNGRMMEIFAVKKHNLTFLNGLCDAEDAEGLVEVKSCQEYIRDYSGKRVNHERYGRFVLNADQHQELCRAGGKYIFQVHKNLKVVKELVVNASCLKLPEFSDKKVVSWRTILKMVEVPA